MEKEKTFVDDTKRKIAINYCDYGDLVTYYRTKGYTYKEAKAEVNSLGDYLCTTFNSIGRTALDKKGRIEREYNRLTAVPTWLSKKQQA